MTEKYKLILGDCLKKLKEIEDSSVDLVVTDPPFFILSQNKKLEKAEWDNFENIEDFISFTKNWINECYRVLKDDSQLYTFWSQMWMQEFWNLNQLFEIKRMLIWNNPCKTHGFTSKMYLWNYTPIFFLTKGKIKKFNGSFLRSENVDVFRFPAPQTNFKNDKQYHFLQKPKELIKILIHNSSNKDDVILDPFMGSGSTGLGAVQLDRKFIGIEKNENYFNISKKRIEAEINQLNLFA